MPNTYTQLYVHIIFTVRGRENLIPAKHREDIHKYITGIVTNKKQKLLSIFAMPDHVHIFVGLTGDLAVSDLVRDIKSGSSKYIIDNNFVKENSIGRQVTVPFHIQIDKVNRYILNQEQHKKRELSRRNILNFLKNSGLIITKNICSNGLNCHQKNNVFRFV